MKAFTNAQINASVITLSEIADGLLEAVDLNAARQKRDTAQLREANRIKRAEKDAARYALPALQQPMMGAPVMPFQWN